MNKLFFDIECCDGKTICSFGYVLTDDKFNILEKDDIIINPESRFALSYYRKTYITLGYPKETFLAAPNFPHFYPRIKSILERDDIIICGHSVDNDVHFLLTACERYSLPYLDIKQYFDSQALYRRFKNLSQNPSLESIAATYNIAAEGLHRSDIDAEITMNIIKNMCAESGKTIEELLIEFPTVTGHSMRGIWRKVEKGEFSRVKSAIAEINVPCSIENARVARKKFAFSKECERAQVKKLFNIIELLYKNGGIYKHSPFESHYYVIHDDLPCPLCGKIEELKREKKTRVKIITLSQFLKMLDITIDGIPEVTDEFFYVRPPYIKPVTCVKTSEVRR